MGYAWPLVIMLAQALALASPARAAELLAPGPRDARIRNVLYNADDVVRIVGTIGYQMVVEFAADERIENVALGDATSWQATPNKRANLLFLKPMDRLGHTNMTVVTDRRRYHFELMARGGHTTNSSEMIFAIRFRYPDVAPVLASVQPAKPAEPDPSITPENWNLAYTYEGAKINVPARVFDDGKATYFLWPDGVATPAIFVAGDDKSESIVNFRQSGKYIVVEQVSPQFILRNGKDVTRLFNDGFNAPEPGPAAPRPREKKKRSGLFSRLAAKDGS